jgi:hypothetical protein
LKNQSVHACVRECVLQSPKTYTHETHTQTYTHTFSKTLTEREREIEKCCRCLLDRMVSVWFLVETNVARRPFDFYPLWAKKDETRWPLQRSTKEPFRSKRRTPSYINYVLDLPKTIVARNLVWRCYYICFVIQHFFKLENCMNNWSQR